MEQHVETISEFNARMDARVNEDDQPELPIKIESAEEETEQDPAVVFENAKHKFIRRKLADALWFNECGWKLGQNKSKKKLLDFFQSICLHADLIRESVKGKKLKKPQLPFVSKQHTLDQTVEVILQYMEMRLDPRIPEWSGPINTYAEIATKVEDFECMG
tara:strand:+ start:1502 stop:1984 length:483 start_codon:yes stop_codon:yes gene_type:complete